VGTLITYLFAGAVAIGYACVNSLPQWRRAVAAALALVLTFSSGELLVGGASTPVGVHALAGPCVLLLAAIMIVPRRPADAKPQSAVIPRQARYAGPRHAPGPLLYDPWGALYASMAAQVTTKQTTKRARPYAAIRARRRSSAPLPASIRRISRCRRP
jgi:hypothetical protein